MLYAFLLSALLHGNFGIPPKVVSKPTKVLQKKCWIKQVYIGDKITDTGDTQPVRVINCNSNTYSTCVTLWVLSYCGLPGTRSFKTSCDSSSTNEIISTCIIDSIQEINEDGIPLGSKRAVQNLNVDTTREGGQIIRIEYR